MWTALYKVPIAVVTIEGFIQNRSVAVVMHIAVKRAKLRGAALVGFVTVQASL